MTFAQLAKKELLTIPEALEEMREILVIGVAMTYVRLVEGGYTLVAVPGQEVRLYTPEGLEPISYALAEAEIAFKGRA